jgi:lipid-A-disaccharide synthase
VKTIADSVSRMLVIFPFEEEFYRKRGVEAVFVGHPLVEILRTGGPRMERSEAARRFGLDPDRRIVGLLPGSRLKEVRRNLPPILGAARLLSERYEGLQFLLPVASTLRRDAIQALLDRRDVVLTDGDFYEALNLCETAIVSSGTATMEVGLLGVPMVVVYRLHPITYGLARAMVGVEMVAMVNLVAGRRIVPELIQSECTAERIAAEVQSLMDDRVRFERTRRDLREMRVKLGGGGSFRRAAEEIAVLLR